MAKSNLLRCYNLVNADGNKLYLYLGLLTGNDCGNNGYRWMFEGSRIPMPVRSGTWFNGFPEHIMLDWLKGNGWALRACVHLPSGKVDVYELPDPVVEPKTETEAYQLSEQVVMQGKRALKTAIRLMCASELKLHAISLYRLIYPCSLCDANHAINEIIASP